MEWYRRRRGRAARFASLQQPLALLERQRQRRSGTVPRFPLTDSGLAFLDSLFIRVGVYHWLFCVCLRGLRLCMSLVANLYLLSISILCYIKTLISLVSNFCTKLPQFLLHLLTVLTITSVSSALLNTGHEIFGKYLVNLYYSLKG